MAASELFRQEGGLSIKGILAGKALWLHCFNRLCAACEHRNAKTTGPGGSGCMVPQLANQDEADTVRELFRQLPSTP